MHSLRTKIAVLIAGITVLAVAVVTLMSVVFIRNTEHQKSDQLLLLLCETGERNLDYYFTSVEKSVRKVAVYAEKDLSGTGEEELREHVEHVRTYFDEIANKTNGVLTYYYRIDPSVSTSVKGFWYTNLDGKDFVEHEVTDITQYDIADTSQLVWFTVPRATGNPIWLPPYVTENLDVRVISYNIPVYLRGQFVGVIGIEIDYSMMAEQVGSIRLYSNGYAFLTDASASILYHPRIDIASLPEGQTLSVPEGVLSDSTFVHYTYEGVAKQAAWLRLSNGMRLYVSVPESETDGEWQQLIRSVLVVSAAVLAVSLLLGYLFSARVVRPLKELTEAAKQTDQGNYDFKLVYTGKDEVGALTNTFSRMAAHMSAHISDLNKRVYVDPLTSVRNKGAYATYIDEMQRKLSEDPLSMEFAVGVFDCDDLKTVNDSYGHDKGDIYLKSASRLICRVFQHSPVFRIGGDEFSVILRNDDYRNRANLIAEFTDAMEKSCAASDNLWEQVHVSMGIAVYDPESDRSVIDTVRRADKTMYTNKRRHKETGAL